MSDTYTKLFRGLVASTIVSEPLATRWLWITMLSQCDSRGCVWGSVPGLARIANISIPECEAALACFEAPDPYSRTKDNDGRRIEPVDGGWRLLNHGKYNAIRSEAERAEYKREWDRKNRPSGHARQAANSPTVRQQSDASPVKSDDPTPLALTPTSIKQEQKQEHVQPPAARSRFEEFWRAYPNKKGKQEAEKTWRRRKLDDRCDDLIAHVDVMQASDTDWQRGYVPMGSTYLNQARWEDVPKRPPDSGPRQLAAPVGKQMQGVMALEDRKRELRERMAGNRDPDGVAETFLLVAGSDTRG